MIFTVFATGCVSDCFGARLSLLSAAIIGYCWVISLIFSVMLMSNYSLHFQEDIHWTSETWWSSMKLFLCTKQGPWCAKLGVEELEWPAWSYSISSHHCIDPSVMEHSSLQRETDHPCTAPLLRDQTWHHISWSWWWCDWVQTLALLQFRRRSSTHKYPTTPGLLRCLKTFICKISYMRPSSEDRLWFPSYSNLPSSDFKGIPLGPCMALRCTLVVLWYQALTWLYQSPELNPACGVSWREST